MTRSELEHILRAAGAISDETRLVVVGSQAILAAFPDAPAELTVSNEADIYPPEAPEKADLIDGSIGERSTFHETFGYYAHGVGPETAKLPQGWESRLIEVCNPNTRGVTGLCISPADLAVSKLVAGREKDLAYVKAMLTHALLNKDQIRALLTCLPDQRELAEQRLGRL